jgi:hypothetical protein
VAKAVVAATTKNNKIRRGDEKNQVIIAIRRITIREENLAGGQQQMNMLD